MAANSKDIRIGPCYVKFNGLDLGLTQGGVEVTVSTETHKTNVDQFGKTTVDETIMGRNISVKVPMVETGLDKMLAIMPGAKKTGVAGVKQVSTVSISAAPADGTEYSVTINGKKYAVTASGSMTAGQLALDLVAAISADQVADVTATTSATGSSNTASIVLTGKQSGPFTADKSAGLGLALTTAGTADSYAVRVPTAIGTSLKATARELVLHPVNRPDNDKSEDLVIPLANTPGQVSFGYKVENERVFPVEFNGYPDDTTGLLYIYGDKNA